MCRTTGRAHRKLFSLRIATVICIGATAVTLLAQPVDANDPVALATDAGAAAFHKNCAACHSIGGQGAGEDISFTIRVPEAKLEEEVMAMEKYTGPLEFDQIMDLIKLMKSTEAADRLKTAKEEIVTKGPAVADAAAGPAPAQVHPGGKAFSESCANCHIIGGQGALTGTDISFTVHWPEDQIKNSVKKMEKYTGPLPPEKVEALTKLMQLKDAAAHIKAAKGGAATEPVEDAAATTGTADAQPSTGTAEAQSTATAEAKATTAAAAAPLATPAAAAQSTPATAEAPEITSAPQPTGSPAQPTTAPAQSAEAPAKPATAEWTVATAAKPEGEKPAAPGVSAPDANDPVALASDAGAAAFHKNCAACHSIGGQGNGEDISFTIRVPEAKLEEEVMAMEKYTGPLEFDQIMDLIKLMKSIDAADRLKTAKEEIVTKGVSVADAAAGLAPAEIHPGGKAFSESCATCHIIGGQGALTGTDISFTVHWPDDQIKNSIKKMEKYTGPLPPEKVEALTKLMQMEDAAAHIKAARGGAATAATPAASTPAAAAAATTSPAEAQPSTATAVAQATPSATPEPAAPATPATAEWTVTTATKLEAEKTSVAPAATAAPSASADAAAGDAMATLFLNKCALCHTIGGGMKLGPDLAPTKDKPYAAVEAAVVRMQVQAGKLDQTQIKGLTDLIVSPDFKKRVDEAAARKPAPAAPTAATTPAAATETSAAALEPHHTPAPAKVEKESSEEAGKGPTRIPFLVIIGTLLAICVLGFIIRDLKHDNEPRV